MRTVAMKLRTEIREDVVIRLTCDLCGKMAEDPGCSLWGAGFNQTRVDCTITAYIDGDCLEDSVDLCPACAERLFVLIRSGGLNQTCTIDSASVECKQEEPPCKPTKS